MGQKEFIFKSIILEAGVGEGQEGAGKKNYHLEGWGE